MVKILDRNHNWFLWLWLPLCLWLAWSHRNADICSYAASDKLMLLAVFGVSASACLYVRTIKPYPPLVGFLYAIVCSIGFHEALRAHCQNEQADSLSVWLLIWSLPVGVNASVYIVGLAASFRRRANLAMERETHEQWFEISLYRSSESGKRGKEIRHYSGPPPIPEGFWVDGFNHDHFIAFDEFSEGLTKKKCGHMSVPVTLYETIEKFGELQQLTYRYELTLRHRIKGDAAAKE
nr:hypothetical protein [uncultured Cohaesibacter sp.]